MQSSPAVAVFSAMNLLICCGSISVQDFMVACRNRDNGAAGLAANYKDRRPRETSWVEVPLEPHPAFSCPVQRHHGRQEPLGKCVHIQILTECLISDQTDLSRGEVAALIPRTHLLSQDSEDIRYMVSALKTLGIQLEERWEQSEMVVHGCNGRFPVEGAELFLGNAGTAMR